MVVRSSGKGKVSRLSHPAKASELISVIWTGTVMSFKLLQSAKTPDSIFVTELGSMIVSKLSQPEKAPEPISETFRGIEMLFRFLQPAKAP